MLYKAPLCLFWEEENGTGFRTTEDQTRIQDYELPGRVLRDGGFLRLAEAWPEEAEMKRALHDLGLDQKQIKMLKTILNEILEQK